MPRSFEKRTARRIKRRSTYPRPSLDGSAPSAIAKATVLIWSEITLNAVSSLSDTPYFLPLTFSISLIIGVNKSVSKFVLASWITLVILSSPIPVSIFCLGSGVYEPSLLWLNSENTKFQISK